VTLISTDFISTSSLRVPTTLMESLTPLEGVAPKVTEVILIF